MLPYWYESMGVYVSFFKKNKSKTKKEKIASKPSTIEIEQDIAKMDQERHLDMQLEELNAKLNIKPEDESVQDALDALVENTPEPETPQARIVGIGGTGFLKDSLNDFVPPAFSAKLSGNAENIDVTPENNTISRSVNPDVEKLIEEARVAAEAEAEANAKLEALKLEKNKIEKAATEATKPQLDIEDELPSFTPDPSLAAPGRLDMGEMRLDVAKISSDIQSGEELYRRALQRVEGLMGYVEKAEVDFSVLNRLEPENRRLKARMRTLQGELQDKAEKLDVIAADLEDHQERLAEKTAHYETARGKLVAATTTLKDYERALKLAKTEGERSALAVERHKTALNVEARENKVLREKIEDLTVSLEERQTDYLNASKMVESLRVDCDDHRDQSEALRAEVQDLRSALNTAKRQNNAMKGEMITLHEDIKTFKTQYEYNIINHEDRTADLESQLAFLSKEVDAKDHLTQTTSRELASLRKMRTEQDIERDRLEKQIEAAKTEVRDITRLTESQNDRKLSVLKAELVEMKTELNRREEMAQLTAQENEELHRKLSVYDLEKQRLESRLKLQNQQLETAIQDNPSTQLEAQIANLAEQLRIKDEIVQSAAQDMTDMRRAREIQEAELKRLQDQIHNQTFQLEAAQKALRTSQQNETDLDQKYNDIAAALSITQARRKSENPSDNPDIKPDISDEFNTLSGDDVEDRILDYKFGLRNDIV